MPMAPVVRYLLSLFFVLVSVPAFASSQLTLSSSGNGVFAVTGRLEGVAGLQISISYDGSLLSNPRITSGELTRGMVVVPNTSSNPVQIAAVAGSSVTASGTVATITFDTVSTSSGGITAFSGTAIDLNGKPARVAFLNNTGTAVNLNDPSVIAANNNVSGVNNGANSGDLSGGGNPAGDGQQGESNTRTDHGATTTSAATTSTSTGSAVVLGGSVTFPPAETSAGAQDAKGTPAQTAEADNPSRSSAADSKPAVIESKPAATDGKVAAETAASSGASQAEAAGQKAAAPAPTPVQSVLERFRVFEGEKTAKNLTALFDRNPAAPFVQSPAIAIADGISTVKVVIPNVSGDKAPTFSLSSAQYVTSERLEDGGWSIEVRPDKGAVKAMVKLFANGVTQEIPLTVTPKAETTLSKQGKPGDSDFDLFLKERGTAAAPKYDLNGDGKRDYVDDYIFTANYLLKMEAQANRKQAAQQKQ